MNSTQKAVNNAVNNLGKRYKLNDLATKVGQRKAAASLRKGSSPAMAVSVGFKTARQFGSLTVNESDERLSA